MHPDKCSYSEFELSNHLNCEQKGYFICNVDCIRNLINGSSHTERPMGVKTRMALIIGSSSLCRHGNSR